MLVDKHLPLTMSDDTNVLAGIVQFYYVRLGIFFGCLGIFSRLIRGEMIERSLHFYLLAPVRREVLLLAKFAAGSISALLLFGTAMLADFALMYAAFGAAGRDYVFNGPGLGQLEAYLAIIVLGLPWIWRGIFLLSMIFKNPTPAAMLVLGWEAINPVLPSLLQKISVASYLRHLMPVKVPAEGIFALLTVIPYEPTKSPASSSTRTTHCLRAHRSLTVGEFRDWLLSDDATGERLAALAPASLRRWPPPSQAHARCRT
jgi:ABC-type transport system involved in multi-copper enzyme maturation permease subunit